MNLLNNSRRMAVFAGAFAFLAFAQPSAAQEVSESHIAAARSAIAALHATDEFDAILPGAAQALKAELIQSNPNLQSEIIQVIDEAALSLASRRGDLEREVAIIYARTFNEAHLGEIATFYQSDAGKALLENGVQVMQNALQAADIWQRGIARDLAQQVGAELDRRFPAANGPEGAASE